MSDSRNVKNGQAPSVESAADAAGPLGGAPMSHSSSESESLSTTPASTPGGSPIGTRLVGNPTSTPVAQPAPSADANEKETEDTSMIPSLDADHKESKKKFDPSFFQVKTEKAEIAWRLNRDFIIQKIIQVLTKISDANKPFNDYKTNGSQGTEFFYQVAPSKTLTRFCKDNLVLLSEGFSLESIVLGLIYIDIFLKKTKDSFNDLNGQYILLAALSLADMNQNDCPVEQKDLSLVSEVPLKQLTILQAHFLKILDFNLYISPADFDVCYKIVVDGAGQSRQENLESQQPLRIFSFPSITQSILTENNASPPASPSSFKKT